MVKGRFGKYGGQYVSEILMQALIELEEAFERVYPTSEFPGRIQRTAERLWGKADSSLLCKKLQQANGV